MSERLVIVDTGPLVASLIETDVWHIWASEQIKLLPAPLLTCEAVLTEVFYLLRRIPNGPQRMFQLLRRDAIRVDFMLIPEARALEKLIEKYQDLPMSLADACLVRMSEQHPSASVFTLDRHFQIYRRNGRQPIPLVMPGE